MGSEDTLQPPAGWPSEEERTLDEGDAPTPFTPAQIREACPARLQITFLIEEPDGTHLHEIQRFDDPDEVGAVVSFFRTDQGGEPIGQGTTDPWRWDDMQRQTVSRAKDTVITIETVEVPAGSFKSMRYVVETTQPRQGSPGAPPASRSDGGRGMEKIETQLWFAYDLPGPPIQWIRLVDGKQVMKMSLLKREIGHPRQRVEEAAPPGR